MHKVRVHPILYGFDVKCSILNTAGVKATYSQHASVEGEGRFAAAEVLIFKETERYPTNVMNQSVT